MVACALLLRGQDGVAAHGRRGRRRAEVRRGAEAGRGTRHHVEPGACGHARDGVGWRCDSAVGPPSRRDSYSNFPDAIRRAASRCACPPAASASTTLGRVPILPVSCLPANTGWTRTLSICRATHRKAARSLIRSVSRADSFLMAVGTAAQQTLRSHAGPGMPVLVAHHYVTCAAAWAAESQRRWRPR